MFCWRENFNVEESNVGKIIVENFQRWKIKRWKFHTSKKFNVEKSIVENFNVEESERWKKVNVEKKSTLES